MMNRSLRLLILALTAVGLGSGFTPLSSGVKRPSVGCAASTSSSQEEELETKFREIATKFRLSALHSGYESKDAKYGVENVRAAIPIDPSLGLELLQVAGDGRGRGLVLVSGVGGNAAQFTSIAVGDSIVGVSCGDDYRQSVTGLDYDSTMDVIIQAKTHAELLNIPEIHLQLNRLVARAPVQILLERNSGGSNSVKTIDGLAGDNLRLVLMNQDVDVNRGGSHCGGGGSCGTCMVRVLQGEQFLDDMTGKKEDDNLRKACQTILGADNQECTVRIELP
ncbi:2Fe-2S iron-sulfur cluster binding domain [Seminavis robusta]|uniref:2Fe-2S iron-sulfur cluster binding domain n=1 Tax=Seminavis robusta TaxID=568900 RepID=A0A9N8DCY8_9STRA|nr:2Fe-2S iron-sulfur cluster binding domain [Seminavis robusta]|eukprot:Sro19_g013540.1 2Fe-2S iron-sulfur cluster binding domain (279) ;mRNA; f:106210-107046